MLCKALSSERPRWRAERRSAMRLLVRRAMDFGVFSHNSDPASVDERANARAIVFSACCNMRLAKTR